MLEDLDYGFNGFDTTFSKNLTELFNLFLTVVFTMSSSCMKYPVQETRLFTFHGKIDGRYYDISR